MEGTTRGTLGTSMIARGKREGEEKHAGEKKKEYLEQSFPFLLHSSSIRRRGLTWANGVSRRSEQSSDKSDRRS